MTNQKNKLKKVISYAVDNGWDGTKNADWKVNNNVIEIYNDDGLLEIGITALLLSHPFAKACFYDESN